MLVLVRAAGSTRSTFAPRPHFLVLLLKAAAQRARVPKLSKNCVTKFKDPILSSSQTSLEVSAFFGLSMKKKSR